LAQQSIAYHVMRRRQSSVARLPCCTYVVVLRQCWLETCIPGSTHCSLFKRVKGPLERSNVVMWKLFKRWKFALAPRAQLAAGAEISNAERTLGRGCPARKKQAPPRDYHNTSLFHTSHRRSLNKTPTIPLLRVEMAQRDSQIILLILFEQSYTFITALTAPATYTQT